MLAPTEKAIDVVNGTVLIGGKHGRFFVQEDAYIGKSIALYGEYSEGEVDLFRHFIGPDDIVMDIGANIGALTIPMANLAREVIAVEPHPAHFDLLARNVTANELDGKVRLLKFAAGSSHGETRMQPLGTGGNRNYGQSAVGSGDIPVSLMPLDSTTYVPGERVSFIKIDVEGFETEVLRGAKHIILRDKPVLYVECDRDEQEAELKAMLRDYGYVLFEHWPHLYNADNYFGNKHNEFPNIVSKNLLCIPEELMACPLPNLRDPLVLLPAPSAKKAAAGRVAPKWAGIVRLGGVGDNLIAASVLRPLKQAGYMVEVIAQEPYHVVFENNPHIDKLSVKDGKTDLPQGDLLAWQKYFVSRGKEYSHFVNLSHSCEALIALFPAMSAFYWPPEFRRKLCDRNYLEAVHDIVGVPHEFGPLFFPTDAEVEQAISTKAKVGERCVGWCLSGTRIDKMYPYAAMAIARIIREVGLPVVMLGGPGKDFAAAKAIMEHVERQNGTHEGLHLALSPDPDKPSWPIRRILSMASHCDVVVSPDTGPAWSVAFEPMPKVIMVSHASAKNITKHWTNTVTLHADQKRVPCWPCHRLHDTTDTCVPNKENLAAACMSDISVECTLTAVKAALGDNASADLLRTKWASNLTV